jgi:hypothetical protein
MKQKYSIETKIINRKNKQINRCAIKFKKKELLNFDFYNDNSGDLQIFLNSYNSKIKSSNKLPDKWVRYIPKNDWLAKDIELFGFNHITLHPRNDRKNEFSQNKRLTRVHFENNKNKIVEEIFAKSKEDKFVPLITFIRERKNGTRLEMISIIQNYNLNDRYKNHENLLKEELETDKDLKIPANFDISLPNFKNFLLNELEGIADIKTQRKRLEELGLSKDQINKFVNNYQQNRPKGEKLHFDFDKNYVLRISEIDDIEMIKQRRKFFDVKELNLVLIGDFDMIKESGKFLVGFY